MPPAAPTLEQLKTRLSQLLSSAAPFAQVVYRSSTPKYAKETDLLTGEGSRRFGGRWNPIGIAAVYASLTPEIAMAEALANNRYFRIPIEDAMPRTFVAIEASIETAIDFRSGPVRQRIQVALNRILAVDWRKEVRAGREPITQLIGKAASEVGVEAMIVPSAANPQGHNLLVFPPNLRPGSTVRVLNSDRLST
jgi:RES domain-containing protein